jgi:ATP-dependent DNA ligase
VLDGELVVLAGGALDFAALMARLHPAASRAARLARETPAVFVAFDALVVGGEDLRARGFAVRRARLERLLRRTPSPHVVPTPATDDPAVARAWFARFRGNGVDGVVAKDRTRRYEPGRRTMVKVKAARTADCVVAGFRHFAGETAVASLLLGLHDGGRLVHFGVASQFRETDRRALFAELRPLVVPLVGHPWEEGFGLERSPLGRLHGAAGRWSPAEMEPDWIPVRPARVCEVAYDVVDGRRLRYPARFVRWRPDRDPGSCRLDQLDDAAADVRALLAS